MNNLEIFKNEQFGEIRTIQKENEIWFVGKDIAECLGYSDTNKAISMHVDEEDKLNDKSSSSFGQRGTWIINESGLYSLVLSSKLPTAKKFKRWVTSDVLPTIRKHGMYATDELLDDPDLLIGVATKLKEEREARIKAEEKVKVQKKLIGKLKPKADYTDTILLSKSLVTISQISKDYGMTAQEMNKMLHELKVQYKKSEQWLLYSKHDSKGYAHSGTMSIMHGNGKLEVKMYTKWTQKGRLFLYELLKENGILPTIEQEGM
ncbi:phage antirepressor [Clostridium sporogenes]|uniref:phage antirepressor n=1 Tax=Clostridium sporogenes TaxID=1509 RepID=UPI0028FE14BC|nr:phage antirepressor [Clostridium botulinum]